MKTYRLKASLTILLIGGLLLAGSSHFGSAQDQNGPPVISSVSPIANALQQTIVIQGSGFGGTPPVMVSLYDNSSDSTGGDSTPAIQVRDNSLINGWSAGYENSYASNGIGLILVSWSDTKIVLGGFGSALSTTGQGMWNMMPGDPIQILVKVSGQTTSYTTHVQGSSQNAGAGNGSGPHISSVTKITPDLNQTIIIKGSGFGDTQPQTVSLGDGSVDTVGGGSTPVLQIHDDGWNGWEAGTQDGPDTGSDIIGVVVVSWSDTQIVLDGFGSVLGTDGQYSISNGDPVRVIIITRQGTTEYDTVIGGSPLNSNAPPALTAPQLFVSCQSQTTSNNFKAQISGNLTYSGTGIPDIPISIYYSIDQGATWLALTSVITDSSGNFVAEWLPSVSGDFMVNATYAGDSEYGATSTVADLPVAPNAPESNTSAFSVSSNSTVTELAFNSTSEQLSFRVTGPSGTTGYADIYITKSLVNDTSNIQAYKDGSSIGFTVTSNQDFWILHFIYHHSSHLITLELNSAEAGSGAKLSMTQTLEGAAAGLIISLSVMTTLLLVTRKDRKRKLGDT